MVCLNTYLPLRGDAYEEGTIITRYIVRTFKANRPGKNALAFLLSLRTPCNLYRSRPRFPYPSALYRLQQLESFPTAAMDDEEKRKTVRYELQGDDTQYLTPAPSYSNLRKAASDSNLGYAVELPADPIPLGDTIEDNVKARGIRPLPSMGSRYVVARHVVFLGLGEKADSVFREWSCGRRLQLEADSHIVGSVSDASRKVIRKATVNPIARIYRRPNGADIVGHEA